VKALLTILKNTVKAFIDDPLFTLSAATAYYAIFSIAPLLVLVVGLAALVFGENNVQREVGRQLESFVGPKATHMIQSMMAAQFHGGSTLGVIVGAVALVIGATAVFSNSKPRSILFGTSRPNQARAFGSSYGIVCFHLL